MEKIITRGVEKIIGYFSEYGKIMNMNKYTLFRSEIVPDSFCGIGIGLP
jgi:hypothetical protein